jgi:PBP1b-binding outer membrane lipoprotein LpoB
MVFNVVCSRDMGMESDICKGEQMKKYMISLIGLMVLSGCVSNHYKVTTVYQNPVESVTITSEVEGKATIGKVAVIYQKVFTFVNKQLIK